MTKKILASVAAVVLAGTAYPAIAQDGNVTADPYGNTMPSNDDDDDDDGGKWGLLGLLGLAGLMGLKRRDHDDRHVHNNTNTTDRR